MEFFFAFRIDILPLSNKLPIVTNQRPMDTPIADIIYLADEISDLSTRISGGLAGSKYSNPDDAIIAYTELRDKMMTMFSYENAIALQNFALETNKNWQELEETKNLTPAELGCDYSA